MCAKYVEKECNLCDSISVHIARLIEDGHGGMYQPGTKQITINLKNLSDCITNVGGDLVPPRATYGDSLIVIESNISEVVQHTRTIHFINAEGDTVCSKTFTFGRPLVVEAFGIVKNMNDFGSLCCSEVRVEELYTSNIDIYAVVIYDPVSMLPYFTEARNSTTSSPFDFSGSGYYFTDICTPSDSVLRYDILLYSADTTLVAHLSFDSLCVSYYGRSSDYIVDLSSYPNPASDVMTVSYELKEEAEVEIDLLDHKGDLISSENLQTQCEGIHTFAFDFTYSKVSIVYILLRASGEERLIKQLIYK